MDERATTDDLTPCPFCDGTDIGYNTTHEKAHWFQCMDCGCQLEADDSEQEAVNRWNIRA